MVRLNVSPTRMNLKAVKDRARVAGKTHKLLKDKLEGLIREFLETIGEIRRRRSGAETALREIFERQFLASHRGFFGQLEGQLLVPPELEMKFTAEEKRIMGVTVPNLSFEMTGEARSYGLLHTSGNLDLAVKKFRGLLPELVELAALEEKARRLAREIESTRRRVNALEKSFLPRFDETIRYIRLRLGENERMERAPLMRFSTK